MYKDKKAWLIFLIIFSHVTILDAFFVTRRGAHFLLQESLHWQTIVVHIAIALAVVIIYFASLRCYRLITSLSANFTDKLENDVDVDAIPFKSIQPDSIVEKKNEIQSKLQE